LVPILSGATKELEKKLANVDEEHQEAPGKKKEQKKEDMKFAIKLLTFTIIIIFIIIVVIMAKFTGQIIYSD